MHSFAFELKIKIRMMDYIQRTRIMLDDHY